MSDVDFLDMRISRFLDFPIGLYSAEHEISIYHITRLTLESEKTNAYETRWYKNIAKELKISESHAELLMEVAACTKFNEEGIKEYCLSNWDSDPFTYGSSPRGLIPTGSAVLFMDILKESLMQYWEFSEEFISNWPNVEEEE